MTGHGYDIPVSMVLDARAGDAMTLAHGHATGIWTSRLRAKLARTGCRLPARMA